MTTPINIKLSSESPRKSPDAMEIDIKEEEDEDVVSKLRDVEVLPQLFSLLHDLDTGVISVRDFDNNAGSVRLKLNTLKQYLQEVEGINESIEVRKTKIDALKENNLKKEELLQRFRSKVETVFAKDVKEAKAKEESGLDVAKDDIVKDDIAKDDIAKGDVSKNEPGSAAPEDVDDAMDVDKDIKVEEGQEPEKVLSADSTEVTVKKEPVEDEETVI